MRNLSQTKLNRNFHYQSNFWIQQKISHSNPNGYLYFDVCDFHLMLLGVAHRVPMWSQVHLQILLSLCYLMWSYYIIVIFFVYILIIWLLGLKQNGSFFVFHVDLWARGMLCALLVVMMMVMVMLMVNLLNERRLIFFIFEIPILEIFNVFLIEIRRKHFRICRDLVLRMLSNEIRNCRVELRIIDSARADIIRSRLVLLLRLLLLISQPKNLRCHSSQVRLWRAEIYENRLILICV